MELVKFDMGLLSAEGAEVEAELLLAYEAPREIARHAAVHPLLVVHDKIQEYQKRCSLLKHPMRLPGQPPPCDA